MSDEQASAGFLDWLADKRLPMIGEGWSLPQIEAQIRAAYVAGWDAHDGAGAPNNDRLSPYPHIAIELKGEPGEQSEVMAYVHGTASEMVVIMPFLHQIVTNIMSSLDYQQAERESKK